MALSAYLKLKGHKQGEIKGSVTQKGQEGRILVIATNHEIISPRDATSGMATGKRQHKPLVITKELDQSSPLLYNALINNEMIADFELQFWRSMSKGIEQQHYTVKLTHANITGIEFHQPNTKNPDLMKYTEYEVVTFTYQKIQWTWNDGGITAQDSL